MAEQDTEPVKVLVRQFGKDTKVDPVLGKTRARIVQAQAA